MVSVATSRTSSTTSEENLSFTVLLLSGTTQVLQGFSYDDRTSKLNARVLSWISGSQGIDEAFLKITLRTGERVLDIHQTFRDNEVTDGMEITAMVSRVSLMAPPTPGDFERCNELRQWCMNHPDEHPRRKSDDKSEAALARWLDRALVRRARAYDNRSSGGQPTATETEQLNSILARPQLGQVAATASATSSGATATELNAAPERAEPPAPFARKRLRQKSSASNRFSTAELVPDVTSSHQMVQRMKRSGHAQFCF